jgi:hypothetical protein
MDSEYAPQVRSARVLAETLLSALPERLAHVRAVAGEAEKLQPYFDSYAGDSLLAAAWLHDIGYSPIVKVTGFHPADGAAYAREAGFDELVVSLITYHSGAAAEARERGIVMTGVAEPPGRLLDALTYCDLTVSPEGVVVTPAERLEGVLQRYGPNDPVYRAVSLNRGELLAAVGRVQSWR